jgi:hypothetical protein
LNISQSSGLSQSGLEWAVLHGLDALALDFAVAFEAVVLAAARLGILRLTRRIVISRSSSDPTKTFG